MDRPFPGEFGVVDGSKPVTYVTTNTYRAKAFRRATRIMQLNAQIMALKELLAEEKRQIARLSELQAKVVEALTGAGFKLSFDKGQVKLETLR